MLAEFSASGSAPLPSIDSPGDGIDWLKRAQDAYSSSNDWFNASIRLDLERDYQQFQGEHPAGSRYLSEAYKGRSRLFDPKTRAAIRKNEAVCAEAFFSTEDVVAVSPEDDSDPMQFAASKMMQFLIQYHLQKSVPWFLLLNGAYQDAQKAGVVIGYAHWDKTRDKPLVQLIPPENFRIDPGADWSDPIGTSPYLIRLWPTYVKDVKKRMTSGEWTQASAETIAESTVPFDSLRQTRQGRRTDPIKQGMAITDYSIAWVHEYIMEEAGQDVVFHTLGQDHLLESPKPIRQVYAHGRRAYVLGICALETHKNYPSGVSRLTRDVQAALNATINNRIDNVNWGMSKRFFVKRGKQIDTLSLTRPGLAPVTHMESPNEDVKVVDIPDVTGSAYVEQDRLNLAFDDVAGNFSNASVESNRRLNETVGGMNLLTSNSNQVGGYQLRTFVETWVVPMLRLIMDCIGHYEANRQVIELAARNANADPAIWDLIGPDDFLRGLTLTANVGMGATNPVDKVNRLVSTMNSLKAVLADGGLEQRGLRVDEVIKELFGNLGYKDGARFFKPGQDDPRIGQLQQGMQELRQALAAKWPPELLAAQIDKLQAETEMVRAGQVEKGVRSAYEAMQAGQVVAMTPQIAPVADAIMEGAGYRLPEPPGVNPNFPAPRMPPFQPYAIARDNTHPNMPANPPGPGVGVAQGIETPEAD